MPQRPDGRYLRRILLAILLILVLPAALKAQATGSFVTTDDRSHDAVAPVATAARIARALQVDGRLDEADWGSAQVVTEFTQINPNEGQPVSERTEVRILYDDDAIYIGATLHDRGEITTRLARRDASMSESDIFVVIIDSYHDHQTAYRFATNPSGMKHDQLVSSGGTDSSWDPVWDVATQISPGAWSVEMRIPFSQLRFRPDQEQSWGIQLERTIFRNQEDAMFAFTPSLERSGVHRFGHLEGIRDIQSGQRLELLPYMTARAEFLQTSGAPAGGFSDPYRSGSEWFTGAGLDLKYRVSSNLTMDATVNPDFGQVEVDPAVINLTAFETRFEERRPFFVEGAEIFRFGEGGPVGSTGRPPEVLYSRRVGRSPQGAVPGSAIFADAPTATTILGAAKLTGRVGEGWSVGLFEAITGRETARYMTAAGAQNKVTVEPLTNYLVGRIRRDARGGNTRFGGMITAVHRDLSDPDLASRLHSSAYSAGIDLNHQWANRIWRLSGAFNRSLVRGDAAAITRTQRASTRYFHRPDASHLEFDPTATSLGGYYAMGELNKQAGTFTTRLAVAAASPGYEVNDLGFQTAADRRFIVDTNFSYQVTRPGRYLRNWALFGGPDGVWNYAGDPVMLNVNVLFRWQLHNYWGSTFRYDFTPAAINDRLTRGGPLTRNPQGSLGTINFNSDTRKAYVMRGSVRAGTDDGGSWQRGGNVNLVYQPRETWEIQIGPDFTQSYSAAQYVTTVTDPLAVQTFGHRYVFAGIDQTTLSIQTRLNVTFSPALSLQMYGQPFLSNGKYGTLKELSAPRTFDFTHYGEDVGTFVRQPDGHYHVDPDAGGPAPSFRVRDLDFNVRSLLGNAVLRWEWRPGSTLFLVWQQSRTGTVTGMEYESELHGIGDFALRRNTSELFDIRPDNIFAVKVNYWLNP